MTDLVDPAAKFRGSLPDGWAVKNWAVTNGDALDIRLLHSPSKAEVTVRCREIPDASWLMAVLALAERVQEHVEVSMAHDHWWW